MAGTRRFTLVAEVRECLENESACTLQAVMEGGGRFTLCRGSEGTRGGVEKESACTLQDVMERGRGVLPYVAEARERAGAWRRKALVPFKM